MGNGIKTQMVVPSFATRGRYRLNPGITTRGIALRLIAVPLLIGLVYATQLKAEAHMPAETPLATTVIQAVDG